MKSALKNGFKYVVMLAITGFLLWISFRNIEPAPGQTKVEFISAVWNSASTPFLFASALMALLSHLIRAERWKLLLTPIGHRISLKDGFYSVMIGYFINLVIPRGGEVSRCYNLYRLNNTPVDVSLGTVVAERVIDLFFLVALISLSFFIELDSLLGFFNSEEVQALRSQGSEEGTPFYYLVLAGVLLVAGLFIIFKVLVKTRRYFVLRLMSRSRSMLIGIRDGLKSVLRLEKRWLFIFYSLLIWVCYYLMMYFVMLAFSETESLGLLAALTIFVIGGIAMAIPLPGGAGSFHILVSTGLILLYGLSEDKAVAFTFIFHAWQTLVIIIVGAISLFLTQIALKYKRVNNS